MSEAVVDEAGVQLDPRTAQILDAVIRSFETAGYDGVNLRAVAREARVSLATIYEMFASREQLCVAAMQRWMDQRFYGSLPEPDPTVSRGHRLLAVVHHLLEPFLAQPLMLTVFAKVRLGPGGEGLSEQSILQTREMAHAVNIGDDDQMTRVEQTIVYHLLYSLIAHYSAGKLDLDQIVPMLDESVLRLMDGTPGVSDQAGGR